MRPGPFHLAMNTVEPTPGPPAAAATPKGLFRFAHLSDIHFDGYGEGATFDEYSSIRTELAHDLAALVEQVGPLNAIVIGGDVAGGGRESEYGLARSWLEKLCVEFGISFVDRVYCVPGNHDVDWGVIKDDPVIGAIQARLLSCPIEEFNYQLKELVTRGPNIELALSGLDAYNGFASQFRCSFEYSEHSWEQVIPLGPLKLQLIGLNSALISGPSDSQKPEESRLALGPQATNVERQRETFTIVVCHHSPRWLRDRESIDHHLRKGHLQLYGHEHSFEIEEHGRGVKINAGAVQPPKGEEDWEPSYNVITLAVDDSDHELVTVDVYPRVLGQDHTFGPADPSQPMHQFPVSVAITSAGAGAEPPADDPPELTPPDERRLANEFVDIGPDRRLRIGRDLGLLGEPDENLPEGVRARLVFDRARDQNRLDELEERMRHD